MSQLCEDIAFLGPRHSGQADVRIAVQSGSRSVGADSAASQWLQVTAAGHTDSVMPQGSGVAREGTSSVLPRIPVPEFSLLLTFYNDPALEHAFTQQRCAELLRRKWLLMVPRTVGASVIILATGCWRACPSMAGLLWLADGLEVAAAAALSSMWCPHGAACAS